LPGAEKNERVFRLLGKPLTNSVNPILVQVTRGDSIESVHRGSAVVVAADGRTIAAWGDVDALIYPRSAIKPLQALPLIATGAALRFGVTVAELALACGSHSGEPVHVQTAAGWLRRLGLGEDALVCGPHTPIDEAAANALAAAGEAPCRLHNNCSGKHAGFLTVARQLAAPLDGYAETGHPVQQTVIATLSALSDTDVGRLPKGIDGCGAPTFALPLRSLALAFARFGTGVEMAPEQAAAARRLAGAMSACPSLVAGTDRFDTRIIAASGGAVLVKGGAEGVAAAALPSLGHGIAVKIDDGAKRAAETAMAALLARLAPLNDRGIAVVRDWLPKAIVNTQGRTVGRCRPAPDWLQSLVS
jgi:L-asparaginase II